jgi:2-polyprenyl-3-methyl-5-hydroxy-6-metoxy-1,4-benzoquinol methylase
MELDYHSIVRLDAIHMMDRNLTQRVLEIGCGTGNTLAYLKKNGLAAYVEGIEKELQCVEALNPLVDKLTNADVEQLGFTENEKFDTVLLLDILEHLVDPYKLLQQVTRLIKPKGQIIISIPNIRNLKILKALIVNGTWTYQDTGILDRTHLRFFTKKSFLEGVREKRIAIEMCDYQMNLDNFPRWIHWLSQIISIDDYLACQHLFKFRLEHPV